VDGKSSFISLKVAGRTKPLQVKTLEHKPPMTQVEYDAYAPLLVHRGPIEGFISLVESVKSAIVEGIHPKMISKGSSGSYFARAKVGGRVQTVA
jgi:hypothetical protein